MALSEAVASLIVPVVDDSTNCAMTLSGCELHSLDILSTICLAGWLS